MRRIFLFALLMHAIPAWAFDQSHKAWDAMLKKHVVLLDRGKASQVNYQGMAKERAALTEYLHSLSRVGEQEFEAWSRGEQVAFLINAYNAYTVEKILARYPDIKSIWDFGKFFGNPFRDGRLEVSKIFDWYKEDFEPREEYFARYAGVLGMPPGASPRLVFLDYDWALNDSRSSSPR